MKPRIVIIDGLEYEVYEKEGRVIVKLVYNGENLNRLHDEKFEKELERRWKQKQR